jgi:hypothetical protein
MSTSSPEMTAQDVLDLFRLLNRNGIDLILDDRVFFPSKATRIKMIIRKGVSS